jgi:hypothetical protein
MRICSAKGVRFIPFINGNENEPQKQHRGACHAVCLDERVRLILKKAAV